MKTPEVGDYMRSIQYNTLYKVMEVTDTHVTIRSKTGDKTITIKALHSWYTYE